MDAFLAGKLAENTLVLLSPNLGAQALVAGHQ